MQNGSNALTQYAKEIVDEVRENGSPTGMTYQNYERL